MPLVRAALLFVATLLIAYLIDKLQRPPPTSVAEAHTLYALTLLCLCACALPATSQPDSTR
jgi:hypothetical protein